MKLRARRSVQKGVKTAIRIGAVPYLNAKPLCAGLLRARFDHPPRLLKFLENGEIDVALLSSIEYLRHADRYAYVPGLGICSDGPVDSVRLYYRTPIRELRTLGLDPHSLTANALAQIILGRNYGVRPRATPRSEDSWSEFDGAVVIGDAAFRFDGGRYIDLGGEWKVLTGLPFVYALWIHRRDHPRASDLARELHEAYQEGARRMDDIAAAEAPRLGLDKAYCLRYLKESVRYPMGPREEQGLDLFGRFLREWGAL